METQADPAVEELVARAKGGHRESFDALYRRFAKSVHSILLARVPAKDSEDLTQEVFLAAHRALPTLRDESAIGPWLHAMARNLAADHMRRRVRRVETDMPDLAAPPSSNGELRDRVLAHIRSLPEAYRETLLMRLVDGLPGPDIAEATGLTEGSVRVNLHRGMELLRERLRKEGWP
jgi:RNA polymerase sigma-70 factor (ECF subfamily)